MDAMKDFLESIKSNIKFRLSNPLYAAYILAWCYLNFRLLLVLFSDGGWREKIQFIDGKLYTEHWHWWWFGFAYPLCVAVGYVVVSPFAYRWVTVFVKEREKLTIEKLMAVASETPLSPDAANRLRKKIFSLEEESKSKTAEAQKELDELAAQVQLLRQENKSLTEELKAIAVVQSSPSPTPGQAVEEASLETPEVHESESARPSSNEISEKPVGRDSELRKRRSLAFDPAEFVGVDDEAVERLNDVGLTGYEILALDSLRNFPQIPRKSFGMHIGAIDDFSEKLMFDRLNGLSLIKRDPHSDTVAMTPLGRQTLAALIEHGVIEKLKRA